MENLTDIKTQNRKTQNGSHSSFIVRSKDNRRCFEKKKTNIYLEGIYTNNTFSLSFTFAMPNNRVDITSTKIKYPWI